MSKFGAVYCNELHKIFKRKTFFAFLILITSVVFALGVFTHYKYANLSDSSGYVAFEYTESEHIYLTDKISDKYKILKTYESPIELNGGFIPNDSDGNRFTASIYTYTAAQVELWCFERMKELDIKFENDYRVEIINEMVDLKVRIGCYEYILNYKFDTYSDEWYTYSKFVNIWSTEDCLDAKSKLDYYGNILDNNDFETYINDKIYEVQTFLDNTPEISNPDMPEHDNTMTLSYYRNMLVQLNYRLKSNITGTVASHNLFFEDISKLQEYRELVKTKMKNSAYEYSPDEIEELQNKIAVLEYRMDNNCYDKGTDFATEYGFEADITTAKQLSDIAGIIFTVMIIMIAASSVSKELETGSVKLLLVTPVKRWKVLTAKFLAVISVAAVTLIWIVPCVIISTGLAIGFNSFCPYIFVSKGIAHAIPFAIFVLLYVFSMCISVLWYTVLALQLSCVLRNTAFATMSSLLVYMLDFVGTAFAALYIKSSWLQFVPTVCVSRFVKTVFANDAGGFDILNFFSTETKLLADLNPWIMIAIITVLTVAMFWTALDSFCRRDIK